MPDAVYAGITGSALIADRATDIDVVAIVSGELEPTLLSLNEGISLRLPKIRVCRADWMNVEIKKARFDDVDRKNYLVALLFERLLDDSIEKF